MGKIMLINRTEGKGRKPSKKKRGKRGPLHRPVQKKRFSGGASYILKDNIVPGLKELMYEGAPACKEQRK